MNAANTHQNSWTDFLAHLLFFLAAWTLFIKYLFPVGYSLAYGGPLSQHIYWDLWPAAHLWLGWALLTKPAYTKWLSMAMAVVEIATITTLLDLFLSDPEWTIWRSNWFINKVFVLMAFILILATALARPRWFESAAKRAEETTS